MTRRVLFVYLLVLLLVMPGMAGVHEHLSLASGHDQIEDISAGGGGPAVRAAGWLDADHQAGHEHHGTVDLEPPAKAFAKSFVGKLLLAGLLACGVFLLLVPAQIRLVGVLPPLRPPKHRSRPYLFPPSHAPPSAG